MTFTKTTPIVLAIALQLIATTASSQTTFDLAELDGLENVGVTYGGVDTIDVSVDGQGHYVGVSYDAGPRIGTDEFLGRSVWSVVVLHPGYKQVLVVTMDQEYETDIVNFFVDNALPQVGGIVLGVTNVGPNPDQLVFTQIDSDTPDSVVELATENHVLVVSGMDPFTMSSYFDWDEDSQVDKVYVADAISLYVDGFESPLSF